MAVWVSIDLDWVGGGLTTPHINCALCSRHCAGRVVGRGRKRPRLCDVAWPDQVVERRNRLKSLLLSLPCRRAIIRDCHADILGVLCPGDFVWHIDAHGDDEPDESSEPVGLTCSNWVLAAMHRSIDVNWVEPHWVKVKEPVNLFVALSRPYTPVTVERWFWPLVGELRCSVNIDLGAGNASNR